MNGPADVHASSQGAGYCQHRNFHPTHFIVARSYAKLCRTRCTALPLSVWPSVWR